MPVRDVLIVMEQIGFTEVILPFILVFSVVFGVLQRSKVLGVDEKGRPRSNYNAMVALVLAFFVLVMFRTVQAISWFARFAALLLVVFVFLGIIFAFLGVREQHRTTLMFVALMLVSVVFLEVLAFTGVLDPSFVNRILLPAILIFAVIVGGWFMLHRPAERAPAKAQEKGKGKEKRETEIPVEQLGPEETRV